MAVTEPLAQTTSRNPWILVLLLVLVPATSGFERGVPVPGLKVSDLLLLALAAALLAFGPAHWKLGDRTTGLLSLYALVAIATTGLAFSQRTDLPNSALLPEMLATAQFLLLAIVAFIVGQQLRCGNEWVVISAVIASAVSALALLQMVDFPGVRPLLATVTGNERIAMPLDWQVYRGTSIFPSWHALGAYLGAHVVLCFAAMSSDSFSRRQLRVLRGCAVMCLGGVLTTATATPLLLAAGGIVYFAIRARRYAALLVAAVGAVLVAGLTPVGAALAERAARQWDGRSGLLPQTLEFRVQIWQRDFLPIVNDHLWVGFGPLPGESNLFSYVESMYISLLLSGGLVLLLSFLAFYLGALRRMRAVQSSDSAVGLLARATRVSLIVLLLGMFIHPYMRDVGGSFFLVMSVFLIAGFDSRTTTARTLVQRRYVGDRSRPFVTLDRRN